MHLAAGLSVVTLAIATYALPSRNVGQPSRHHVVANLRRDITKTTPALRINNGTKTENFDYTAVNQQLQELIEKYSEAYRFLNGIGLNPSTHPDTGYAPFDDSPIIEYFQNASAVFAKAADASTEPIIGLPQANYASFANMPLTDYVQNGMDVSYYGPLQFGTPAQELTVSVDTGSADLWIPAACNSCSNAQFRPATSSTFRDTKKKVSLVYGAGRVSGTIAQDVVTVGSLSVDQQRFVAVKSESNDFMDYPSSGLIGLAFQSISRMNAPNVFENLLSAHKLSAGIFSIHLARGRQDGSQICFGCYDLTKTVGPVRWLNLMTKTYWTVHMDGLATNETQHAPTDLTAAIDSGTTLMLVPDTVAQSFYALIPGAQDATMAYGEGFYTYPCSTPLSISLSFDGQYFSMRSDDFNMGKLSADSTDCVGGIVGVDSNSGFPPNLAIVGDIFLKSWYSTFDYAGSRVGFAPSVNNK